MTTITNHPITAYLDELVERERKDHGCSAYPSPPISGLRMYSATIDGTYVMGVKATSDPGLTELRNYAMRVVNTLPAGVSPHESLMARRYEDHTLFVNSKMTGVYRTLE